MFRPLRGRVSTVLIALGAVMMLGAATVFTLAATGIVGDSVGNSEPRTVTGFGSVMSAATPPVRPSPASTITTAPLERIVIPGAKVDAPIVTKGIDANNVMESPDNADDVAWYDFTARPGAGSNAVFSGHLDYVDVGPAVFWDLNDLVSGDDITIRYADGTLVTYAVTAVNTFDADTAPIDQIVGPTLIDSITLITCAGTFDRETGQYDQRLIVRAERV